MNQQTDEAVRREVTVHASPERAFSVFTDRFDAWWPRSHHIGGADLDEAIIEPQAGGRWYERDTDGGECDWGTVTVFDPPRRLVVTWQINAQWQYDPDPDHASEVEVRFTEDGGATLVELEHRHIDRHGADGEELRKVFESPGGWPGIMERYQKAAA
jgi:uncharacterized protein YndB with AHSA1/START domain